MYPELSRCAIICSLVNKVNIITEVPRYMGKKITHKKRPTLQFLMYLSVCCMNIILIYTVLFVNVQSNNEKLLENPYLQMRGLLQLSSEGLWN